MRLDPRRAVTRAARVGEAELFEARESLARVHARAAVGSPRTAMSARPARGARPRSGGAVGERQRLLEEALGVFVAASDGGSLAGLDEGLSPSIPDLGGVAAFGIELQRREVVGGDDLGRLVLRGEVTDPRSAPPRRDGWLFRSARGHRLVGDLPEEILEERGTGPVRGSAGRSGATRISLRARVVRRPADVRRRGML